MSHASDLVLGDNEMFVHHRARGLFIKKIDKGEADQLFTVYTRNFGRLEVLAKGIKKMSSKLRSQAEIFVMADIEFIQGKTYKTLTDAVAREKFKSLKADPEKMSTAGEIANLMGRAIRGQEQDKKIWNLVLGSLAVLGRSEKNIGSAVYQYFFWNLLDILGYRPRLYHCCLCAKRLQPDTLYFLPLCGGIGCRDCFKARQSGPRAETGFPIRPESVKIVRLLLKGNPKIIEKIKISAKQASELDLMAEAYLSTIL